MLCFHEAPTALTLLLGKCFGPLGNGLKHRNEKGSNADHSGSLLVV